MAARIMRTKVRGRQLGRAKWAGRGAIDTGLFLEFITWSFVLDFLNVREESLVDGS